MVAKRRDDVSSTALGQLAAKDLERPCDLVEELGGRRHDEPSRVSLPGLENARVDIGRSRCILGSQRILVVVAAPGRGRAQMDDSVVPAKLRLERGSESRPVLL
ncbi:hypothetical protein D3C83_55530 [compost metagenome]